jgi:3-phenylpropionate/trans-cinnamate dioxygenase ferredoxin reductase component
MKATRYLIVGGGQTAHAAVGGIRAHDPDGSIAIVGAETEPPYKRPPLTKGLWKGADESKLWLAPIASDTVEVRSGRKIVELDADARVATDDTGERYGYEKLLLATGGRPRELSGADGVIYFRTVADYRRLRERAAEDAHVVVIGGGFIGSEIAAALIGVGCRVTMVVPEPAIAARLFPDSLAAFVTQYYRDRGVDVLTRESVTRVERTSRGASVTLGSGTVVEADAVVAGIGITPRTELAAAAGIRVDDGVVVDAYGRAEGRSDVFAAGDVANFPSAALGRRMRVEHEDHAKSHGAAVGANMAGAETPYTHLPLFYSDMFDLGYEAVGEIDARMRHHENWVDPNREGIVTYVDERDRPRGFLLWNTWDKADAARDLIRGGLPVEPALLAGT